MSKRKLIGYLPTTGHPVYKSVEEPKRSTPWSRIKRAWCEIVGHRFMGWNWNNLRTGGYTCARCGCQTEYWNDLGD